MRIQNNDSEDVLGSQKKKKMEAKLEKMQRNVYQRPRRIKEQTGE